MAKPLWTIYYADGTTVSGRLRAEWRRAPDEEVQAVVLWRTPPPQDRPWRGVRDRYIWTGDDFYSPFGWDELDGSILPDAEYGEIARRAFYERP